jgi:hypothetical protein
LRANYSFIILVKECAPSMLRYEFVAEPTATDITGFAGLLPYIDLACLLGVLRSVDEQVGVAGPQGWLDRQHVLALMLLNLAGGECIEDIRLLEADAGLCRMVRAAEKYGLRRPQRRALELRFRKGRERAFPSPTRLYEYLNQFHDADEEGKRVEGKAFIPAPNAHLAGLAAVNTALVGAVQRHRPQTAVTLDIDATLQETHKREALYCYQGYRAYQPLNVYWAETGLLVHSEFRDGNVPAGHEVLRVLKAALASLPAGVEKVRVRMDSAGYQHAALRFCATGDEGRREVIEFTVSNDMTAEFRQAAQRVAESEWRPLYRTERGRQVATGQEWAPVVYVPNAIAYSKEAPDYRYLAIREKLEQGVLPGMEGLAPQPELPFATVVMENKAYRLRGIVTNREGQGAELIQWHYQRCGKSEEAHAILKTDLAGGRLPSGKFGANAAWWAIAVLAYNLHMAMRRLALPGPLTDKRLKALRFALIRVPGRVVERGRQLFVRLREQHPALAWLQQMRRVIQALQSAASLAAAPA